MDLTKLDAPYPLTEEQKQSYRERTHIKLKEVLPRHLLSHFGDVITWKVEELNTMHLHLAERATYDRAFLQVMNIWTESEAVRRFVFGKRLARIAAELMGVSGVRLYHDQALYKEPGGGHTPWHADQFYWPLASTKCTTAWIPLQDTWREMGPLEFATGSHELTSGRELGISDDSERIIGEMIAAKSVEHVVEPFNLGDVSLHSGWTYHRAAPNTTEETRRVMCIIYMDENMRLKAPENDNQQADWDAWCPGAKIGEIIDTQLNPVLYSTA